MTRPAASCGLISPPPPHRTLSESLLAFSTQGGSLQSSGVTLKKTTTPNHKANKRPIRSPAREAGVPGVPLEPVHGQPLPLLVLAPVPRVSRTPPPCPPSTYRARRLHRGHLGLGPDLLCGATRGLGWCGFTKSSTAHNRSWPPGPWPASQCRGASSGPRPSRRPVHPGKGRPGRGPNCLLPTKAPGQEDAVVRSWLPGLLFEQNQRESRTAQAGPGRAPCARGSAVGRAKPGGPR